MAANVNDPVDKGLSAEAVGEMAKYGITRIRIDHFLYGGFRYTHLEDAIAEAKRHPGQGPARLA